MPMGAGWGGMGAAITGGTGTTNRLAKFDSTTSIDDTSLSESAGAVSWITGLGAIAHLTGPTDQTFSITSGTGRGMAIGLAGQTISSNSQITFPTGLGAITQLLGPTDQPFKIGGGSGQRVDFATSNTSVFALYADATGVQLKSTYPLRWSSGNINSASDTGFERFSAAVVKVTNGGTGYGRLRAEWPRREFGVAKTPGTGATVTAYGGAPTHTLSGTASNVSDSTGHYVQLSVDTATGGINIEATECTKTENGPIFTAVIKTGAVLPIATERLWVGLGSASLAAADSPSGLHVAAFRYAPTTDTTAFWRAVTNDGGADAGTTTTSTVAIAVSTRYRLTIDATNSASITFYVDGALIATHATNVPTATQALGTACHVTDVAAGDTKELLISSIRYETN